MNANVITINITERYQTMDGFDFALTAILEELFRTDKNNIGVSYLRLSIGSSDLLNEAVYSYDDLPLGEIDTNMTHFTLDIDRQYGIPVLKEILVINPQIKLLGSS